jgi:hypothetical protein
MAPKPIAKAGMYVCLGAAIATGWCWRISPQTVEGARVFSGATEACQAVVSQFTTIQQAVLTERQSGQLRPLAALDSLVSQESRVDTSKCPPDFRMAVMRFVATEATLGRDAHMNAGRSGDAVARFVFDILDHKSPYDHTDTVMAERKQDVASVQAAFLDLEQSAMRYGVK